MALDILGRVSLSYNTTNSIPSQSQLRDENGIKSLRYEEAMEGKPPIPVTVPPPRVPPAEPHPAFRRPSSALSPEEPMIKRDSALTSTTSTTGRESTKHNAQETPSKNVAIDKEEEEDAVPLSTSSVKPPKSPESPGRPSLMRFGTEKKRKASLRSIATPNSSSSTTTSEHVITTPIPTDDLIDMDLLEGMTFSKRGSIMFGGKKGTPAQKRTNLAARQPTLSLIATTNSRILSSEIEEESQKVRSMYESPDDAFLNWRDGRVSALGDIKKNDEEKVEGTPSSTRELSSKPSRVSVLKREHELAGGLEDWEDVQGEDVDRYGFICVRQEGDARPGTPSEPPPPQRVSTVLQLVSDAPRPQRSILGRATSSAKSTRSVPRRALSRRISRRSLKTIESDSTTNRNRKNLQSFRSAVNHLPGNQHRRMVDEAGDMLTLPPGLAGIAESAEGGKAAEALKLKEWARSEKWRKMAKVVKNGKEGEGMDFEFDVKNSKLIERTWKGIPDRWRATAWFSFLSASAKKTEGSATDDDIINAFHHLLNQGSADDLQIDIDVPRTINSHIMFRKRYRGGQRLLFRVLHCLSLHFPETGYVQGMASLAATLLCYYDEEKTFIMLVRMWQLRGLDKLYANGFGGLMSALDEFHNFWLAGSEVAQQLRDMSIEPTAYCTRWYLTLFNYSIPFPAQLRVWDVFMLLGDSDPAHVTAEYPFGGCLDIIHATGAALIEGTRDIVLDSDFENAMKVLTSWIPVKDEEMLMSIAKVKWKLHHGKRSRGKTSISKTSINSQTST